MSPSSHFGGLPKQNEMRSASTRKGYMLYAYKTMVNIKQNQASHCQKGRVSLSAVRGNCLELVNTFVLSAVLVVAIAVVVGHN